MKKLVIYCLLILSLGMVATACGSDGPDGGGTEKTEPKPEPGETAGPPEGKAVFTAADDLKGMDLTKKSSKWCWQRSKATEDVILFWAKGFGDDLSKAPTLQGQDMRVDADLLLKKTQEFYDYYYDVLKFVKPGKTKADKYRMMIMLDYSLEGTAYGGTSNNEIGTLWVAPNRVQDKNMNAVAHELGHCFQLQIIADGDGDAWGGCGFYEMTSQWMLWRVNPEWTTEERYHLYYPDTDQCFAWQTHKAFLHSENIYRSPYIIECWADLHGLDFIAELYRAGKVGEDPVITYKKLTGLDQDKFNDEMWRNSARITAWDFDRTREYTSGLCDLWKKVAFTDAGAGWQRIAKNNCPQNYGFNAIAMTPPEAGKTLSVEFRGEAGQTGFNSIHKSAAGWRYGFVAIDSDGNTIYGDIHKDATGTVGFSAPEGKSVRKLWLVVMGAPVSHYIHNSQQSDDEWPYSIKTL